MAGTSAAGMAARLDAEITRRGQAVSIYHPARTISAGVVTEGAVTLAGTSIGLLEETPASQDMATGLGIDPGQLVQAYLLSTDAGLVTERSWIQDAAGAAWLVQGYPAVQVLEGVNIGCNLFLRFMPDKPVGMP